MSVFQNALMFTIVTYGILYDCRILLLFLGFLGFNVVMHLAIPNGKWNGTRRKIMNATWDEPREGCVYIKVEIDCTNVNEVLKGYKGEYKPTLTHFGIKAIAQVLNASRWNVNGKFLFGKFVPFPTVDVTCLVDIEGGKVSVEEEGEGVLTVINLQDLAAVTVDSCDEMSVV